jgi:hypothetical protein
MTFHVDDRVIFSVPTKYGYEVGRATVKRILEVTKDRKEPIAHLKCDVGGLFKYVDFSCLTHLLGKEAKTPEVPETYELVPATEAI